MKLVPPIHSPEKKRCSTAASGTAFTQYLAFIESQKLHQYLHHFCTKCMVTRMKRNLATLIIYRCTDFVFRVTLYSSIYWFQSHRVFYCIILFLASQGTLGCEVPLKVCGLYYTPHSWRNLSLHKFRINASLSVVTPECAWSSLSHRSTAD